VHPARAYDAVATGSGYPPQSQRGSTVRMRSAFALPRRPGPVAGLHGSSNIGGPVGSDHIAVSPSGSRSSGCRSPPRRLRDRTTVSIAGATAIPR
jgi:hypothetical protein